MEKDCIIAYGSEHSLLELFISSSDLTDVCVYKSCDYLIAYSNNYPGPCKICGNETKKICLSYSSKMASWF
ncbi:hypothetical protein K502DRAFT_324740 [Neoconidiobolus thromboides FSU 785]|nr:hypothetical protein K502DRAFT_324740 [Neoconidiobolus thromboides FSU 785]